MNERKCGCHHKLATGLANAASAQAEINAAHLLKNGHLAAEPSPLPRSTSPLHSSAPLAGSHSKGPHTA